MTELPTLGVVVVAFNSADVILDCVETLLASEGPKIRLVVVDNASPDNTVALLRDWAAGRADYVPGADVPFEVTPLSRPLTMTEVHVGETLDEAALGDLTLLHAGVNGGFASGVNRGLEFLAAIPGIDHFWVLNPDSVTPPGTAAAFAASAAENPGYGMMGGRVCYTEPSDQIQIDGGVINRWTGVSGNIHLGASHATTPSPKAEDLDFITGASMVVSRTFYEQVGHMVEDYFLYYEEVDWAMRRGDLELIYCTGGLVYHRAGTAIGSPTLNRFASPFSLYFKHRGRMRFVRRFNPVGLPVAWAYGMAKVGQMAVKGAWPEVRATLAAIHGLNPPETVSAKLSPDARAVAFGTQIREMPQT